MNHLEKRGLYDCTSYIKPGSSLDDLLDRLSTSCGCHLSASGVVCRGLDVVQITNPLFWIYQCTCKESISDGCEASVEELDKVWIKVPKDDDKICADGYKRTKTLAKSCN